jgi:hypothetical protein
MKASSQSKLSTLENFGLLAGEKLLRTSLVLNLPRLIFLETLLILVNSRNFFDFSYILLLLSLVARRGGTGKEHYTAKSSSEDEEDDITDTDEEDSGDSSDDDTDGDRTSDAEEDSPKVDITG